MPSSTRIDHWTGHARRWEYVGHPLRPGPVDVRITEEMIQAIATRYETQPAGALLLGVTPELVGIHWPSGTGLLAVDRSLDMIRQVLPRQPRVRLEAVSGNWLHLPLPDSSFRYVVGDGCLTVLEAPAALRALSAEVRRVLTDGGGFVIRQFVQLDKPELPEQVLAELLAGRIGNFHIFKWRLAMALQQGIDYGVQVRDIWHYWQNAGIQPRSLSERFRWPLEEIETIDTYRESAARYTFPTLEEARDIFSHDFRELDCRQPDYELGERCPTLLLKPRP